MVCRSNKGVVGDFVLPRKRWNYYRRSCQLPADKIRSAERNYCRGGRQKRWKQVLLVKKKTSFHKIIANFAQIYLLRWTFSWIVWRPIRREENQFLPMSPFKRFSSQFQVKFNVFRDFDPKFRTSPGFTSNYAELGGASRSLGKSFW